MSKRNKILTAMIAVLVMVLVSCGITIGYHYLYVRPVDTLISDGVVANAVKVNDLELKQEMDLKQISAAMDFIVVFQQIAQEDTQHFRGMVGKALGEVVTNFEEAEARIKTLERRHLEVLRAIAILDKKHWDPEKAAEASGLR